MKRPTQFVRHADSFLSSVPLVIEPVIHFFQQVEVNEWEPMHSGKTFVLDREAAWTSESDRGGSV